MFVIDDIINGIGSWLASDAQQKNVREAMGVQKDIWNQQRSDQMPWMQAGQSSIRDLYAMTQPGYDHGQMASDPGYQFRMAEGQKALERSAAARGGLNSGRTLKGLARYSQGVASEEFGNRFNRLAGIAGMGQGSAQHVGNLGGNYANSLSSLYGAMGNAQSAGIMGMTNGITGGIRSAGNLAMMYAGGGMGGLGGAAAGAGAMGASGAIPTQGGAAAGFGGGALGGGAAGWNPYANGGR